MTGDGRVRVVAYGSLRLGGSRSSVFEGLAVPTETVLPGFRMLDTGHGFPMAMGADEGSMAVTVWTAIDPDSGDRILAIVDDIEGVAVGLFERAVVQVGGDDAVIYLPGRRLLEQAQSMVPVVSGDWLAERESAGS